MNPYNKDRTCGGSSGGDAGLVAARCVPLAIGTDIGGSIRVPAGFTGVRGFKPTNDAISLAGNRNVFNNNFNPRKVILSSFGPIGKTVDDLVTSFKV
jgi:fatty acid amide hydrolase